MILSIETGTDNTTLRTKSTPVTRFDSALKKLAKEMIATMSDDENPGVGLAAPQIGRTIRLIIVDITADDREDAPEVTPRPVAMVNPTIVTASEEMVRSEEGCLSLPKKYGHVLRHRDVVVRYRDITGREQTIALDGLPSRCIQHEIDHLDGILFVDRLLPDTDTPHAIRREDVL